MRTNKGEEYILNNSFYNIVTARAVETYGGEAQIKMAVEEMSELTQALMKSFRKDVDINAVRENIVEEIADVEIMLDQLKLIFSCYSQVFDCKEYKINRLAKRIEIGKENDNKH